MQVLRDFPAAGLKFIIILEDEALDLLPTEMFDGGKTVGPSD